MSNHPNCGVAVRGLGTDILEISRMRRSIERQGIKFIERIFTLQEQKYCTQYSDPVPRFTGRFVAKEAIVKALGTGFGSKVQWQDIEVLNDFFGKPVVFLSDKLQYDFNNPSILISISHSTEFATAVALWI